MCRWFSFNFWSLQIIISSNIPFAPYSSVFIQDPPQLNELFMIIGGSQVVLFSLLIFSIPRKDHLICPFFNFTIFFFQLQSTIDLHWNFHSIFFLTQISFLSAGLFVNYIWVRSLLSNIPWNSNMIHLVICMYI